MKKTISLICVILLLFAVLSLSSCALHPYDEKWIIGKTSDEIMEKYGDFDLALAEPDEDGIYRNTRCGYMTKEGKKRLFGTSHDEFYCVYFDSEGVAYKVKENCTRPGG